MYAQVENQVVVKYPIVDIASHFPNVSFPANVADGDLPDGYVRVQLSPPPNAPFGKKVVEVNPTMVDGKWVQTWSVIPMLPSELDEAKVTLQRGIVARTQARLDAFAQTRNYDGILSACTYATSTVSKFAAEGQYCVQARDATWATLYEILAEVEAGDRPMPTEFADIEPELPVLTWPN